MVSATATEVTRPEYPVKLQVAEPAKLSRWLWIVKWLLAIPNWIVLGVVGIVYVFTLFFAWVAAVLLGRYPRGLFDFNVGFLRWTTRLSSYTMGLVTDQYPPFAMRDIPEYPVRVTAEYPARLSRLKAFFRIFLAVPHLVIVWLLNYVWAVLWLIAGVIILFTGRYQKDLFRFVVGIMRWNVRSTGYLILATDKYPPFSLE
ncbi:MAG: DUF4389 domain-containing protein [Chloroflexi bacterium]|nr:DUF4389 domain-containing protein [Chloroflexota bacterium]